MRSGEQPPSELLVGRTRASRLPSSTGGSRDKFNKSARHDRLIAPEAQNHGLDNFPDQPGTVVLIGIARHGLGTIVRPFKHFTFHNSEIARG